MKGMTGLAGAWDAAGMRVILAGVILGMAGDLLLWETEALGPGFALWVLLLGGFTVALNREAPSAWRLQLLVWSGVAFLAAGVLVFRAALVFLPLMAAVLVSCSVLVIMQAGGIRPGAASVSDHVRAFLQLPLRVVAGGWPFLQQLDLRRANLSSRWQGIVRGAVLSLPLLLVFVALFSSADATFERYTSQLGDLLAQDLPRHVLVVTGLGWLSTGLLACTLPRSGPVAAGRPPRMLGAEEATVILGSLALLFLVFVIVQLGYLFGGRAVIEQTSGLTLAQYARRGFFELMVVSILAMAVLHWVSSSQAGSRLSRLLALTLVALVLCILVSAAQRLALYMSEFGLTLARLLAVACMAWIVCNLLLFSVVLLQRKTTGLASGYLRSGIAILLVLALVNPAAIVASVNLRHAVVKSSMLDVNYLLDLGPDAVPAILDNLDELPAASQCVVARGLLDRYSARAPAADWRSWNASRAAAVRAVREHPALPQLACAAMQLPVPALLR